MEKKLIKTYINTVFCEKKSDLEYLKSLANEWTNRVFPEGDKEIIQSNVYAISDFQKIRELKKAYNHNKDKCFYSQQFIVFLSIYDVHPSIKRACRYIYQLQNIGYTVYIVTLNPWTPCSEYLIKIATRHGVIDCVEPIIRHGKYDEQLMEFAAGLRICSPPVKYRVIEEKTTIPRPTIHSYIMRNRLVTSDKTGRDYLTEKEEKELEYLIQNGSLYDKDI